MSQKNKLSKNIRSTFLLILLALTSACATTNRAKHLQATALAAAGGAVYGNQLENNRQANALLYAGAAGLLASLAALYIFDDAKRADDLQEKLDEMRTFQGDAQSEKALRVQGKVLDPRFLPSSLKGVLSPGEVSVYEEDRWEQVSENKWEHTDLSVETTPPTIKPKER